MKRTNVYVDGYNLYYGLLKGTPNKWLDLSCLVRGLLAPDHEIGTIYYFTSIITPYPYDASAIENQNVYLQALATRKDFGKQVLVFNPHESNSLELKMAATFYRSIPRDLPARCQFPDEIPTGKKGKVIRRPSGW